MRTADGICADQTRTLTKDTKGIASFMYFLFLVGFLQLHFISFFYVLHGPAVSCSRRTRSSKPDQFCPSWASSCRSRSGMLLRRKKVGKSFSVRGERSEMHMSDLNEDLIGRDDWSNNSTGFIDGFEDQPDSNESILVPWSMERGLPIDVFGAEST